MSNKEVSGHFQRLLMCGDRRMGRLATDKTYRIVIEGSELIELKRHAHQIPECPGLDRRIQRFDGNKPFVISLDELDWLVAVLDAVLHDPKG